MKKGTVAQQVITHLIAGGGGLLFAFSAQAFDVDNIAPQAYHPGGINYWSAPYLANAIAIEQRNWFDADSYDEIRQSSGQLNANGYPKYLDSGQTLKTLGIGMEGAGADATWPDRDEFYEGQIVLTWKGNADVRNTTWPVTFVPEESNTGETGSKTDGRRVYILAEDSFPTIEIHAIDTNNPITDVKCWLPDPDDPQNSSLEEQLFHPFFIDLIDDREWGWIRFMDFGYVNQNPQQDWIDRRPGGYAFQEGVLNERSAAEGLISWIDKNTTPATTNYFAGDRETGASFEMMVALCNETDRDMWINIPHLATDDFITKLAQLIRYGSDGFNPYTSDQADPVFPPLNSNLTVYVEYSNEIWSNGNSFPQGNWAQEQANNYSGGAISRAKFNARQFSRAWELFEAQLGTERVNRVAAVFTSNETYTSDFINELYKPDYLDPEMMAVTTYFGNGIQNWANDQNFVPIDPNPRTNSYWTSQQLDENLNAMFNQWKRYVLSGRGYGGDTGYDSVDVPGGFGPYISALSLSNNLPIVAYEGGPSVYTDHLDHGGSADDGITMLMVEANRRQEFGKLYTIHINQGFERGLRASVGFTDVSFWGKYGQWGHVEYLGQPKEEAVKYQVMLNTFDTFSTLRPIANPINAVPQFDSPVVLPRAETGASYSQTITVSGGDGDLTVEPIGISLPEGLSYNKNTLTIFGTPTEAGSAYVYLRVIDADNDPAWRTFTFPVVERSSAPAITIDFEDQTSITNTPLAMEERYAIGDYAVYCSHTHAENGIGFWDNNTGDRQGWASIVLHGVSWNYGLGLEREDNEPFDLFSLEIGSTDSDRCQIIVTHLGGGTSEQTVSFSKTANPITLFELDLVSVIRVEFRFMDSTVPPGGNNEYKFGAIDNLKLNQIKTGTYAAWGAAINWDGADSAESGDAEGDGIINLLEYATDTDPLNSNTVPAAIATDPSNIYLNYRRNTLATDLIWQLKVTTNLQGSWDVWAVDDSRVFSDIVDPDTDGDGSASLMRYRILPQPDDQNLFFRLEVE